MADFDKRGLGYFGEAALRRVETFELKMNYFPRSKFAKLYCKENIATVHSGAGGELVSKLQVSKLQQQSSHTAQWEPGHSYDDDDDDDDGDDD